VSRSYLVSMPRAEARHLAGIGPAWPAAAETRCIEAIREWLHGIQRRRAATVPVARIVADLTAILGILPAQARPVRGPFARPADGSPAPPGRAEYLGGGVVRLDEAAISSLARLLPEEDFHVMWTSAGPVLTVGADRYLACEEGGTRG
jgi:hypothetical protein